MPNKQSEWPTGRSDGSEKRSPTAIYAAPDAYLKSNRSVAGPLRMGTAPGVGPKGAIGGGFGSDLGTDRVSKRGFDPIGTSDSRDNPQEASTLVSREVRSSRKNDR